MRAAEIETIKKNTKPDLKVLIVEDSEDDCLLLVYELRKGGYQPVYKRVENQDELLSALNTESWDVVITDHRLPQFSSDAALKTVLNHGLDIPVIIVSGSIGEDFAITVMRSGAHDYIMKGNLARLVPAIEREIKEANFRKKARHQEKHDALTGLRNRTEFECRLKYAVLSANQNNLNHAFIYLDLDQFKIINDTCGHDAGDKLLNEISKVIRIPVRDNDVLARLGGDEFGILLECCPLEKAIIIADNILSLIQRLKFIWQDKSYTISGSIGLVMISDDTQSQSEILSAADIACYAAKDSGRNRLHVYNKNDSSLIKKHGEMHWVMRVKEALKHNKFFLCKQKIVALQSLPGVDNGYEFLVRMRNDDGTISMPDAFISAAERYNIMPEVDEKVIDIAFAYIANQKSDTTSIYFINLSGETLNEDSFCLYVQKKLKQYQLSPKQICFEITETATIQNLDKAIEFIAEVRKDGFLFALDDFGAGISSYNYLKSIPVDYIKIDGSFVVDILDDPMDRIIVESVAKIGKVAGLKVIAEYVENEQIKDTLIAMGIDMAQGYCLHKPEPI